MTQKPIHKMLITQIKRTADTRADLIGKGHRFADIYLFDLSELATVGMTDYADLSRLFHTRLDINPFDGEPLMEAFAETQRNYMRFPALAFDFWGIFMPEVEAALNGQKSAEDALMTTAERVNERIRGE